MKAIALFTKVRNEFTDRIGLHRYVIRVMCKVSASKHNLEKMCKYFIRVYVLLYVLIICLQNISIYPYTRARHESLDGGEEALCATDMKIT